MEDKDEYPFCVNLFKAFNCDQNTEPNVEDLMLGSEARQKV